MDAKIETLGPNSQETACRSQPKKCWLSACPRWQLCRNSFRLHPMTLSRSLRFPVFVRKIVSIHRVRGLRLEHLEVFLLFCPAGPRPSPRRSGVRGMARGALPGTRRECTVGKGSGVSNSCSETDKILKASKPIGSPVPMPSLLLLFSYASYFFLRVFLPCPPFAVSWRGSNRSEGGDVEEEDDDEGQG